MAHPNGSPTRAPHVIQSDLDPDLRRGSHQAPIAALAGVVDYRFHHFGIAMPSVAAAERSRRALGLETSWTNELPRHQCVCHYCEGPGVAVEFVIPLNSDSSVNRIPNGLHHVAVQVDDIGAAAKRLREHGFRLLEDEAIDIMGRYLVNFLDPIRLGFLVELVEELESRG
jgi:methylmalonyl-CoA/ethylmalonyl-CoA epimerase